MQKLEDSLLMHGRLRLNLECQCVRCLKPFQYHVELDGWTCHLPLQGEDCVVAVNDCVDLTPQMREDILLEFPWHPLCDPECSGLPITSIGKSRNSTSPGKTGVDLSAWAKLNKLKL
ncbi:MAG: YceD family protein [Limisphaerales bacterium]